MPKTIRLSDLQLILLTHAASRNDGQLLPFPPSASEPTRTTRECRSLLRRDLVAEAAVTHTAASWRTADDQRIGLMLTEAGLFAIGVVAGAHADAEGDELPSPALAPSGPRSANAHWSLSSCTTAKAPPLPSWSPPPAGCRTAPDQNRRDNVSCYRIAVQR